uniref:Uncharacterized protein n=1 Tax=Panagrolaimus sp. ES5 TaxID=591445 RepID=A0AC34FYP0_9BILA
MPFLLAIEPFWGRAFVYNVETKEEIEFSIQLVLSNDYDSSYHEAVNLFNDLKNQLEEKSLTKFSKIVIEVTEAQSDETQQAILTAANNVGFEKAKLVLYENTRLLWALNNLKLAPNMKDKSFKVAVVDVWQNEAFGYLLECKNVNSGVAKFKPCGYYSAQSDADDGFEASELKKFAQKLCHNQNVEAIIISSNDYNSDCEEIFPNPIFYDADERRGTLLKAIALYYGNHLPPQSDNLHIDVTDTLEYSLKIIIGDQKYAIAEAYNELPIAFEKFCRQWPLSTFCESYGRTSFDPKKVIKIKCTIDNLRNIDLTVEKSPP